LKLLFFNPFRNANAKNEGRVGQLRQFGLKLVAMVTSLELLQNELENCFRWRTEVPLTALILTSDLDFQSHTVNV